MSGQPLVQKLAREFARNRLKTGVLALLCVYALYMWAPLVLRFGKPAGKSTSAAPDTAEVVVATPASSVAVIDWEAWRSAVEHDDRLKPVLLSTEIRDPFLVEVEPEDQPIAITVAAPPEPVAEVVRPEPTPAALGLVLRGTVVGQQLRSANINGVNYLEGEWVRSASEGAPAEADTEAIEFQLVYVAETYVELQRAGTRHRLLLVNQTSNDRPRISIQPAPTEG